MVSEKHIVEKSVFQLEYTNKSGASRCNAVVESMMQTKIIPEVELVVDTTMPSGIDLVVSKLEINVGTIREEDLSSAFPEKIKKALTQALQNEISTKINERSSKTIKHSEPASFQLNALETYLLDGYMPNWLGSGFTLDALISSCLLDSPKLFKLLLRRNKRNETFLKRLVNVIEQTSFQSIVFAFNEMHAPWLNKFEKSIQRAKKNSNLTHISVESFLASNRYFMLSYLLNNVGPTFNKTNFLDAHFYRLEGYLKSDFYPFLNVFREQSNRKNSSFIPVSILANINNKRRSANNIKPNVLNRVSFLIDQLNTSNPDSNIIYTQWTREEVLEWLASPESREVIDEEFGALGLKNIMTFILRDGGSLYNFVSVFFKKLESIIGYNRVKEASKSLTGLLIETTLFTAHNRISPEQPLVALSFMIDVVLEKISGTLTTESLEKLVSDVSQLSLETIQNELKTSAYKRQKQNYKVATTRTSSATIKTNASDDLIHQNDTIAQNLAVYFLNFGYPSKGHASLIKTDLEEIFISLFDKNNDFFELWVKTTNKVPQYLEQFLLSSSKSFVKSLNRYLMVRFKSQYDIYSSTLTKLKNHLLFENTSVFKETMYVNSFLKTLVVSKIATSYRLFQLAVFSELQKLQTRSFTALVDSDARFSFVILKQIYHIEETTKLIEPTAHEVKEIEILIIKSVNTLVRMHPWNVNSQDLDIKFQVEKIALYASTYPDIFGGISRTFFYEFPRILILLRHHLDTTTWNQFKVKISSQREINKQISLLEEATSVLFPSEGNDVFQYLSTLKDIDNLSPIDLSYVLIISAQSEELFLKTPFLNQNNKWSKTVFYGNKQQQSYLKTLSENVPKTVIKALGTSFWNFMVYRFAVDIKLENKQYSPSEFAQAFLEFMRIALAARKQESVYYKFISELRDNTTSKLDFLVVNTTEKKTLLAQNASMAVSTNKTSVNLVDLDTFQLQLIKDDTKQFEQVLRLILDKPEQLERLFSNKRIKQYVRAIVLYKPKLKGERLPTNFLASVLVRHVLEVKLNKASLTPDIFSIGFVNSLFENLFAENKLASFDVLMNAFEVSSARSLREIVTAYKNQTRLPNHVVISEQKAIKDQSVAYFFSHWMVLSKSEKENRLQRLLKNDTIFQNVFKEVSLKGLPVALLNELGATSKTFTALYEFHPVRIEIENWQRFVFKYSIERSLTKRVLSLKVMAVELLQGLRSLMPTRSREEYFQDIIEQMTTSSSEPIRSLMKAISYENSSPNVDTPNKTRNALQKEDDNSSEGVWAVSAFQFYNQQGYLPWWARPFTLTDVIEKVAVFSNMSPVLFEKEMTTAFVSPILFHESLFRLPTESIDKLEEVMLKLDSLSEQFLKASQRFKNDGEDTEASFEVMDVAYLRKRLQTTNSDAPLDEKLLDQAIYLLSEKDLIDVLPVRSLQLRKEILKYVGLSPNFFMDGLTPLKWRQIVYGFVFMRYSKTQDKELSRFKNTFNMYLKQQYKQYQWSRIFQGIYDQYKAKTNIIEDRFPDGLVAFVVNSQDIQEEIINAVSKDSSKLNGDKEGVEIKIANAGLVILWPFLTRLFEQLELMSSSKFVNREAQNRAVFVLQYISHNAITFPEYALVLNKMLVGLSVEEHLEMISDLTQKEKDTAASLMQGLKANWEKMKTSTTEAIQETFIRRDGSITLKDDKIVLTVERKGVDVLLTDIQWNLTTVKLPWMHKPLFIKWI